MEPPRSQPEVPGSQAQSSSCHSTLSGSPRPGGICKLQLERTRQEQCSLSIKVSIGTQPCFRDGARLGKCSPSSPPHPQQSNTPSPHPHLPRRRRRDLRRPATQPMLAAPGPAERPGMLCGPSSWGPQPSPQVGRGRRPLPRPTLLSSSPARLWARLPEGPTRPLPGGGRLWPTVRATGTCWALVCFL